jgi:hypothetical protein
MKRNRILFIFSLIASITISLFIGVVAAQVAADFNFRANPLLIAGTVFTFKAIYFYHANWTIRGLMLAGVNQEVWIEVLKENFFSKFPWLDGIDDWSEFVENNTINFASMGTNPVILKNNAAWPIVAAQRTDTAGTVTLDTYDSTTTRVRNVEEIEASYKKLQSVTNQHKKSLMQEIVTESLWNMGPLTAAAGAIATNGSNRPAVIGAQSSVAARLAIADILTLQERWDSLDFPTEGRVMVLNPYHRSDLMLEDKSLFKSFTDLKKGEAVAFAGFEMFPTVGNTPLYTKSTLAKKAYGAAADNTNDCVASVAFCQSEAMKCLGDTEMFFKEKKINPEQRADEIGFQQRTKVVPTRVTANYQQALVSNRA